MNFTTIIAIDPGASGAAVVGPLDGPLCWVEKYGGLGSILTTITKATMSPAGSHGVAAIIERVWASPIMSKSGAFAFGENYGRWCGALSAVRIPVFTTVPQVWQKRAAPHVRGQGDARKAALKMTAEALFDVPVADSRLPLKTRITLSNCDALLLHEYARLQLRDGLPLGEPLPV